MRAAPYSYNVLPEEVGRSPVGTPWLCCYTTPSRWPPPAGTLAGPGSGHAKKVYCRHARVGARRLARPRAIDADRAADLIAPASPCTVMSFSCPAWRRCVNGLSAYYEKPPGARSSCWRMRDCMTRSSCDARARQPANAQTARDRPPLDFRTGCDRRGSLVCGPNNFTAAKWLIYFSVVNMQDVSKAFTRSKKKRTECRSNTQNAS